MVRHFVRTVVFSFVKRLTSFTLVGLLVCASVSNSDSAPIPPDVKKVVTFIFLSDERGNLLVDQQTHSPVANGTGSFVGVKLEKDPSKFAGYLVTAKHVLKDKNGSFFSRVYVRLNKKQGDAEFIPLDLTQNGHSVTYTHADPTVDIAVIPALPNQDLFDFKVVSDDYLTTKSTFADLHISEGSDVFFAGMFLNYYGDHRNNPIVRFGRVAMLPEDRILWQTDPQKPAEYTELYLLEVLSYPGNSGSPVFFYLGSDREPGSLVVGPPVLKLAGIMSGYFFAPPAVKMIDSPTSSTPLTIPNSGIAAVTPSFLLHDILFGSQLKDLRTKQ